MSDSCAVGHAGDGVLCEPEQPVNRVSVHLSEGRWVAQPWMLDRRLPQCSASIREHCPVGFLGW